MNTAMKVCEKARGDVATVRATPRFSNVWCSQCGREFGPGEHGFSHCRNHSEAVMGRMYGYGDSATFPAVGQSNHFDPRANNIAASLQQERAMEMLDNPAELSALFGFDKLSVDMHGLGDSDALETAFLILQHYRAGRHDIAAEMDREWRDLLATEIIERELV